MLWASFFHKTSTILSHKSDIRNTNIIWAIWTFVTIFSHLPQPISESLANRWHAEDDVEISFDVWKENLVKVGEWPFTGNIPTRGLKKFILIFKCVRSYTTNGSSSYLTVSLNSLENLCFLLCLEKVWNLPSVEYHADVFHEGFVLNLKVSEQEHNLKISR